MRRGRMHIAYWWESQKERPLGRPKRRWVDNIKMDLRWEGVEWSRLISVHDKDQRRVLVNMTMNLRVP
jgi:hypothetical protein